MRFEKVHTAPSPKGAVTPPALSPKDFYERKLLQEKMWRLTLGKKQGMCWKPSESAEGREEHFFNLGAAVSRRGCSIAKSAPTQATQHVPCFPGTNTLAIYCISPIPYHLSILLKYLPVRLQRSSTSCFLTKIAHSQNTWYFLIAVQQRHVLQFLHNSLRSELLWPCCSFTR